MKTDCYYISIFRHQNGILFLHIRPVSQINDPVAVLRHLAVMGDDNDGPVLHLQSLKKLHHIISRIFIQRAGRLVGKL